MRAKNIVLATIIIFMSVCGIFLLGSTGTPLQLVTEDPVDITTDWPKVHMVLDSLNGTVAVYVSAQYTEWTNVAWWEQPDCDHIIDVPGFEHKAATFIDDNSQEVLLIFLPHHADDNYAYCPTFNYKGMMVINLPDEYLAAAQLLETYQSLYEPTFNDDTLTGKWIQKKINNVWTGIEFPMPFNNPACTTDTDHYRIQLTVSVNQPVDPAHHGQEEFPPPEFDLRVGYVEQYIGS